MKKLFLIALLFSTISIFGQEESEEPTYITENEIKINGLFLLVGYFNLSYERIINEDWGVGLSIYSRKDNEYNFYPKSIYNINTRYYFGNAYAESDFFIEGAFSMYKNKNNYFEVKRNEYDSNWYILSSGIGYKNKIMEDVFTEAFISGGIWIEENSTRLIFPARAGLLIGYRF